MHRVEDLGLDVSGTKEVASVVVKEVNGLTKAIKALDKALAKAHKAEAEDVAMKDHVIPALAKVRAACDEIEQAVPADLWPLPTYREMLFVK